MPFIESMSEFAERMRCTPITVRGRFLFPNGAQSNGSEHRDPPDDPQKLAVLKHEYTEAKLKAALHRYSNIRETVKTQNSWHAMGAGPTPDTAFPGWRQDLKKLAAEIEALMQTLRELAAQLPKANRERQDATGLAERQQHAAEVAAVLEQLPVY